MDADLPETSVVRVKVGQEVECLADAFPSRVFKGKVAQVSDVPDPRPGPGIYSAVVGVTNPGLDFRRGMSVRLSFTLAHRPDARRRLWRNNE